MPKRRAKTRCNKNCLECEYAIPLGEGDFLCDITNNLVATDYAPVDNIEYPTRKELDDYVG